MTTLETIIADLKTLPPHQLENVAAYLRQLKETTRADRLAALKRSAEILSDEEGAELERSIAEGCGRVDPRPW